MEYKDTQRGMVRWAANDPPPSYDAAETVFLCFQDGVLQHVSAGRSGPFKVEALLAVKAMPPIMFWKQSLLGNVHVRFARVFAIPGPTYMGPSDRELEMEITHSTITGIAVEDVLFARSTAGDMMMVVKQRVTAVYTPPPSGRVELATVIGDQHVLSLAISGLSPGELPGLEVKLPFGAFPAIGLSLELANAWDLLSMFVKNGSLEGMLPAEIAKTFGLSLGRTESCVVTNLCTFDRAPRPITFTATCMDMLRVLEVPADLDPEALQAVFSPPTIVNASGKTVTYIDITAPWDSRL